MVDQKKTAAWQAELSKCTDTFASASPSMIDCIMAAKNEADLKACLK
jgi:hypothetical protein